MYDAVLKVPSPADMKTIVIATVIVAKYLETMTQLLNQGVATIEL